MLLAQMKELEKLQMLAGLPSERVALADKYSQFDEETGEPTHDKEGQPLEGKVMSNLSALVAWEGLKDPHVTCHFSAPECALHG